MADKDDCDNCPNRDSCSNSDLASEAFTQAYQESHNLLDNLLDGTSNTQGFITRAESPDEARGVFKAVLRGMLTAVIEAYQDEGVPSHGVMLDVAVTLDEAYSEINGDDDSNPEVIEIGGFSPPDSKPN